MTMKKLISLLAIALMIGGGVAFAAYDEGTKPNNKELSKGTPADPVRVYTLVRYGQNSTENGHLNELSAGEVVVWDAVSDDGVTIGKAGVVGSSDAVAGVVVGTIQTSDNANNAADSIGSRNWGYIQTYGLNPDVMIAGSSGTAVDVAGQAVTSANTTALRGYAIGYRNLASGPQNVPGIFGYALDTTSTDATDNEVFIRCR